MLQECKTIRVIAQKHPTRFPVILTYGSACLAAGLCCHRPAPLEPDKPVSRHPAQAAHKPSLAPETRSWATRTCALLLGCPHTRRWEAAPADLPPSSALPPQVSLSSARALSDQTEVSPLAREGMLSYDAPPIRTITARPSLSPSSSTQIAIRILYSIPTRVGAMRAYHVPQSSRDGLGPLWTPVAEMSTAGHWRDPAPATCLLAQACQQLWLGLCHDA